MKASAFIYLITVLKTMIDTFEQHMLDRQDAQKDTISETIKHFYSIKIISDAEYSELAVMKFPEKTIISASNILHLKLITLSHQLRHSQNADEKFACLSQQIVLLSALSLLANTAARENIIALRFLNTIVTIK